MSKAAKHVPAPAHSRKSAKPLQAAKPADTIRALVRDIPAHRRRHPDAVLLDDDATPAQRRAHRACWGMQASLDRASARLARKKAHTLPELAALLLAFAWRHEPEDDGEAAILGALVRGLCGVDPDGVLNGASG
jgi:hypothetical protein